MPKKIQWIILIPDDWWLKHHPGWESMSGRDRLAILNQEEKEFDEFFLPLINDNGVAISHQSVDRFHKYYHFKIYQTKNKKPETQLNPFKKWVRQSDRIPIRQPK